MPKRTDIRSILLIGSGPIVIGQACEFDYSGTQACKALREEGYRVILVNSNPATIMTDPEFADRTYIEPMTVEVLERIIAAERPDALLPTIGGQTGLNLALDLATAGVLTRHGVELIGASVAAIRRAEDRDLFKETMQRIGLDLPRSGYARSLEEADAVRAEIALPLIIRPSRTLGGTGGSFATTEAEFRAQVAWGLEASPTHEILVEESIAGWKEFELEVMRDAIRNDITREAPACFEPTIDYVVTKVPRFTFEKFPQASDTLGPQMKSVGEVMAIGRTFKESLQKALRSLEIGSFGFEPRPAASDADVRERLRVPNAERLWYVGEAFRRGLGVAEVARLSAIDPWFLRHVEEIIGEERALAGASLASLSAERLRALKQMGFADARLAELLGTTEDEVRDRRFGGIEPVYKTVDTCGAEFEAYTPYLYSAYEEGDDEVRPSRGRRKVVILGGGPNRIRQGIEFDYCCVHAARALREDGLETIMVNCNPETVSTDYDTSDKLFFEPLTLEDTLALLHRERPEGVIVQFGGQTPLRLAVPLARAGVPIVGTSPDSIDRAEDRERFEQVLTALDLRRPPNGVARSAEEAAGVAERIGYPILVRPSYVLGGRAMEIVYDPTSLALYMKAAVRVSPAHPVLIDHFLEDATEVDVDAVSDGERVVIGGIMEHIERAGVHSGDSACSLPPYSLGADVLAEIRRQTVALARELGVVGLTNVHLAVKPNCVS